MYQFNLPDMSCGHCVGVVTRAIQALDPDARIDIDLPAHQLRVQSAQPQETLAHALAEAGYPAG